MGSGAGGILHWPKSGASQVPSILQRRVRTAPFWQVTLTVSPGAASGQSPSSSAGQSRDGEWSGAHTAVIVGDVVPGAVGEALAGSEADTAGELEAGGAGAGLGPHVAVVVAGAAD